MQVLLLLAQGFEILEFSTLYDVMGWACHDFGRNTQVVTCGFQKQVKSAFGVSVTVDILIDQVKVTEYDALAIPGGLEEYGYYDQAYDRAFLDIIREFDSCGKLIASICVGALPIGKSGVLKDRKATTYYPKGGYRQKQLRELGVEVVNEPIVIDKNIITSYGPQTAAGVAFKLLETLTSKEQMEEVKRAMCFK